MDMWGVGCVMFEVAALFPLFPGGRRPTRVDCSRYRCMRGDPLMAARECPRLLRPTSCAPWPADLAKDNHPARAASPSQATTSWTRFKRFTTCWARRRRHCFQSSSGAARTCRWTLRRRRARASPSCWRTARLSARCGAGPRVAARGRQRHGRDGGQGRRVPASQGASPTHSHTLGSVISRTARGSSQPARPLAIS